jgi:uncharacterized integral membrane protein
MKRKPIYKLIVSGVIIILIILIQINGTKNDVYVRKHGLLTKAKVENIYGRTSTVQVSINDKIYSGSAGFRGNVGDSIKVYYLPDYSNVILEDERVSYFQFIFMAWYFLIAVGVALLGWGIVGVKVKIKQPQIKTTKRDRRREFNRNGN